MRRFPTSWATPLLVLALTAAAVSAQQLSALYVNGKKSAHAPVARGGEVFVPVAALREAGAEVTVNGGRVSIQFVPLKGQNQLNLVEGVAGEFVNNGTWRIKAGAVKETRNPFGSGPGYEVEVEFRNASAQPHSLHGSGLASIQLADAAEGVMEVGQSSFPARYQRLPPGGSATNRLVFGNARGRGEAGNPEKLLLTFRSSGGKPALKGFRINLRGTE